MFSFVYKNFFMSFVKFFSVLKSVNIEKERGRFLKLRYLNFYSLY